MRYAINLFFLALILTGCHFNPVHKEKICDCCGSTYTSIDMALDCIGQHPVTETSADHRLLLLALVRQNIKASQQLGWNILKDDKIIQIAQRDYLLVTLDADQFNKKDLFSEVFLRHKNDSIFYMVVNQALYPLRDWGPQASKEEIIDDLRLGNGP